MGDHGHGATAPFLIERQGAVARPRHQLRQALGRQHDRQRRAGQCHQDDPSAMAFVDMGAAHYGDQAHAGGEDGQHTEGADQAQLRDQHETGQ
ncbi:hypothetical protein D3C85_1466250 [compost metagenome]